MSECFGVVYVFILFQWALVLSSFLRYRRFRIKSPITVVI
jgi:hypothetical protein